MKEFKTEIKQLKRIYYDENTGYLCDRYPTDIPHTEDSPFIEVDNEQYEKTFCVEVGKTWAVVDGKLEIVDEAKTIENSDYQNRLLNNELADLKSWFTWYDTQTIQYARDIRIYENSKIDIAALDAQALIAAERIKQIENLLKEEEKIDVTNNTKDL